MDRERNRKLAIERDRVTYLLNFIVLLLLHLTSLQHKHSIVCLSVCNHLSVCVTCAGVIPVFVEVCMQGRDFLVDLSCRPR